MGMQVTRPEQLTDWLMGAKIIEITPWEPYLPLKTGWVALYLDNGVILVLKGADIIHVDIQT